MVEFFVTGIPSPGGSKNAFKHPHSSKIIVVDAGGKKTKRWRDAVAEAGKKIFSHVKSIPGGLTTVKDQPLMLHCIFYMPRPKSHYDSKGNVKKTAPPYPTTRPDTTKLLRPTEDALKGIAWPDDAQIVDQYAFKRYGEPNGALIRIEVLS